MKESFSQRHKESELDTVYIEEDGVLLNCEVLEGEGKNYMLTGKAEIDGEIYHDFKVEFELLEYPREETIDCVMTMEWNWYDYIIED